MILKIILFYIAVVLLLLLYLKGIKRVNDSIRSFEEAARDDLRLTHKVVSDELRVMEKAVLDSLDTLIKEIEGDKSKGGQNDRYKKND
jgi:uncharacterized protein YqeY